MNRKQVALLRAGARELRALAVRQSFGAGVKSRALRMVKRLSSIPLGTGWGIVDGAIGRLQRLADGEINHPAARYCAAELERLAAHEDDLRKLEGGR